MTFKFLPAALLFSSVLALTCAPGLSQTSPPALTIGQHKITLGMPADVALAALRQDLEVYPFSGDSQESHKHQWTVFIKKPATRVGEVYANEKSAIGVTHLVFEKELKSAQDVFEALYKLSAEHAQAAGRLSQWTAYTPGVHASSAVVLFACGEFRIRLVRSHFASDNTGESNEPDFEVWEDLGIIN
jgi:hypothetical protein